MQLYLILNCFERFLENDNLFKSYSPASFLFARFSSDLQTFSNYPNWKSQNTFNFKMEFRC